MLCREVQQGIPVRMATMNCRAHTAAIRTAGKAFGGYPLQYIAGSGFMSLAFEVTPDVMIPRQETELLVETVLDYCRDRHAGPGSVTNTTGSGSRKS